jgi:hypothetical protein
MNLTNIHATDYILLKFKWISLLLYALKHDQECTLSIQVVYENG